MTDADATLPRVTEVLRALGFSEDLSRFHRGGGSGGGDRTLVEAKERGTAVHLACQLDDEGDLDETSVVDEVRPFLQGFRQFRAETQSTKSIWWERKITHYRYGFVGRPDNKRWLRGRRTLIDIKTGDTFDPAAYVQLGLYAELDAELAEPRATEFALLVLRPCGRYVIRFVERDEMDRGRADGLAAIRVFNRLRAMGRI